MLPSYFEGTCLTIRTDDKSLEWMLKLADVLGRFAWWRLCFSKLEYEVVNRAGIKNQAADALSRIETTGADTDSIEDNLPGAVIDTNTSAATKRCIEYLQQALCQIIEDKYSLKEVAAPTTAIFLQHQTTDLYCRQAAHSVRTTNAKHSNGRAGPIVRVTPINGAVKII